MKLAGIIAIIGGAFLSIRTFLKFIVFQTYRLDDSISATMIDKIVNLKHKIELDKEISTTEKKPTIYSAYVHDAGLLFFFSRDERLLTAGWKGKEIISSITFFRFQTKKILDYISLFKIKEEEIKINMLSSGGSSYSLGALSTKEHSIVWDKELYHDIELDIKRCLENKEQKTGCLLYGAPGTGKTRFSKYIAQKYALPIYMVQIDSKSSNIEILQMFNAIPKKCIVLFEDFDSLFDKRKCLLQTDTINFTFDSILNGLDGVFNNYEQVVFMMTANDITKIDDAIKLRSSRFKFVREITNPSFEKRFEIIGDEDIARITDGVTLDKLFFIKSLTEILSKEEIIKKLENNDFDCR